MKKVLRRGEIWRCLSMTLITAGLLTGCSAPEVSEIWYRAPLTGNALEHFERAEAAVEDQDHDRAIEEFAKTIRLAPTSIEAHESYIEAASARVQKAIITAVQEGREDLSDIFEESRAVEAALRDQYERLLAEDPGNALYTYLLGSLWYNEDTKKSQGLVERALELEPALAPAWVFLTRFAGTQSDTGSIRRYYRRAIEAEPDNLEYEASLIYSYSNIDWHGFQKHAEAFITKYPENDRIPSLYYGLATGAPTAEERIDYYRRAIEVGQVGSHTYSGLYDELRAIYPEAAVEVAQTALIEGVPDDHWSTWSEILIRQTMLNLARTLRRAEEPTLALEYLDRAAVGESNFGTHRIYREVDIERALAYKAVGETQAAKSILLEVLGASADPVAWQTYVDLKIGEGATEEEALRRVWSHRLHGAKSAPALGIPDIDGEVVDLDEYKGQIVLINFWYPNCGPCRVEFPYLAETTRRYTGRGFAVLAINGIAEYDEDVAPFMEHSGYPFRALLAPEGWAEETYGVRGYPTNFLLGPDGEIISKPDIRSAQDQEEFEQWLDSYLAYLDLDAQIALER